MIIARSHVLVCGGTGCAAGKSIELIDEFEKQIKKYDLVGEVKVVLTGCFGLCALGPVVIVYPEGAFYSQVQLTCVEEIVSEHLLKGRVVERLLHHETDVHESGVTSLNETGFYKKQIRVALRNCGVINPEEIREYIAYDGYTALATCLTEKTPEQVIEIISASGLRGRGGAGFPTGLKWKFAAGAEGDVKYVACNADEGDPGAFMDRSILEGDPHTIIEAMVIAGYAIGAHEGFVYCRAEYPIAVRRFEIAIEQAKEYGFLGKNIFDSGFDFDLKISVGAGAFVCGEETALLTSLEGKRGEPRPRPPFPAVKGLYGKPTVLNNVETYANIPWIINNGPEKFAEMGTEKSKGTKVYALGGKIAHTGLIEVPMGMSLREIVEVVGGGIPDGKKFKAAQTGGPSGGCIPASLIDTPLDYESMAAIGSIVGSGGLIIMDEDNCMVDIARYFLEFTVEESCGKCTPCRIGTFRMLEMLDNITQGKGKPGDIEELEHLGEYIKEASLCALGGTAPNPVLSTIKYFREEYEEHINDKKCRAGVCKELLQYVINDKCIGCTLCKRVCPAEAITGEKKEHHVINQDKCVKCGECVPACKFKAIDKI